MTEVRLRYTLMVVFDTRANCESGESGGQPLAEPSIVARKLAPNRRIVCATPAYLAAHGTPKTPDDLVRHNCLPMYSLAQFNEWAFENPDGAPILFFTLDHDRTKGAIPANARALMIT